MRILWLYFRMPVSLQEEFGSIASRGGSWVDTLLKSIIQTEDNQYGIIFPYEEKKIREGTSANLSYFAYPEQLNEYKRKDYYTHVIKKFNPDIVHIWGSESVLSRQMVDICDEMGLIDKTVLNLQGLCFICFFHFRADIPHKDFYRITLRDFLRSDSLRQHRMKFYNRGEEEKVTLRKIKNVIGRTDWDHAGALMVNPKVNYYFCNEILRDSFYDGNWNYADCRKHTIFMSQGNYPIKGLHYMLRAMRMVLEKFPNTILRISGMPAVPERSGIKRLILESGYEHYIRTLIKDFALNNHVYFLGDLDEAHMRNEYLRANVFVSPSTVENESNSLSEAKILGVPVVASFVGGVTNRIKHGYDGYAYQHDSVYMLAYYICEIFAKPDSARRLGQNARKEALKINDRETNTKKMLSIYQKIYQGERR